MGGNKSRDPTPKKASINRGNKLPNKIK